MHPSCQTVLVANRAVGDVRASPDEDGAAWRRLQSLTRQGPASAPGLRVPASVAGLHWRHSIKHGEKIGREVTRHVVRNFFRPVN